MPDAIVFIDANVYLDFYQNSLRNYRKLLQPVAEISDVLLTTRMVVDEFNRNRLSAYVKENSVNSFEFKFSDVKPYHLGDAGDEKEVAKEVEEINSKIKKIVEIAKSQHKQNVEDILSGTDEVSRALGPVFSKAKEASTEELEKARFRREIGNPPGKPQDPLGDQISWQQLLSAIYGKKSLWIVSKDNDYFDIFNKTPYLKPFLRDEVLSIESRIEISVYNDLAQFFKKFPKPEQTTTERVASEVLDAAKKEYDANVAVQPKTLLAAPFQLYSVPPGECPNSPDKQHRIGNGRFMRPSQFGGYSWWASCDRCGVQFDTGEPYDD
ncbi:PIN domain-containing protein [Methylorubrum extorquens]